MALTGKKRKITDAVKHTNTSSSTKVTIDNYFKIVGTFIQT